MSKSKRDFYQLVLTKNICEVRFTNTYDKTDTEQVMNCCLLDEYVTNCHKGEHMAIFNDDTLKVVDVDRNEWRLLAISKIKSFKVLTGTISELPTQPVSKPAKSKYATVMPDKKDMDIQPMMVIRHKLEEIVKNSQAMKQPIITARQGLPARQRWMLESLRTNSCNIVYRNASDKICKVDASLEPWVLSIVSFEPVVTSDQNIMKVIDMSDGRWIGIPFNKVVTFKTPLQTYEPKGVASAEKDYYKDHPDSYANIQSAAKKQYVDALREEVCVVEFEKSDGTLRHMNCTLNPKTIIALNLQPKTNYNVNQTEKDEDDDLIRVVDIDIEDWRSFRISKLKSFIVNTQTGKSYIQPKIATTCPTVSHTKRVTTLSTHI